MHKIILFLIAIVVLHGFIIQKEDEKLSKIDDYMKLKNIVRSIDGSGNNIKNPNWGKSHTNLLRISPPRYQDGKSQMIHNLPNPRFLSQTISRLDGNIVIPNQFNLTMLWGTWGQFLDHDMSHSFTGKDMIHIPVPRCDRFFDPKCTGTESIDIERSQFDPNIQLRTPLNQLTVWVDASMVYGSTVAVNKHVRSFERGKLKSSSGQLLPIEDGQFYAGDLRATQNMGLTTLQILFLREHNRICDAIYNANKTLSDEEIYTIARNYVIGLIQKISYYDYLPHLFGQQHFKKYVGDYKGYNSSANPTMMAQFSGTTYRIGHPYVTHTYKAVNNYNKTVEKINLIQLLNATVENLPYLRVDNILKGLSFTLAKQRNLDYVDQLRNVPKDLIPGNLDLFSINVFRNRDHGITDYNTLRQSFGLKRCKTFQEIFDDQDDRDMIRKTFVSIDNIDAYIGVLGQIKLQDSMLGQLGATIAGRQFKNVRDGDRFWFQSAYPKEIVNQIMQTTITDIIYRNFNIQNLSQNPFFCNDCTVE